MTDTIAHSRDHSSSAALAAALARRLELASAPLPLSDEPPDAAVAVAPASAHLHRAPGLPVLCLTRAAAARPALQGRSIVCGVQDEADAPALAIAAAVADALGLPLVLVHVLAPIRAFVPGAMATPGLPTAIAEDRGWARAMLGRVAVAAGLGGAETRECRVDYGPPGPALAAFGRSEEAAMIVVSASGRSRLLGALTRSATRHLAERSERPVLVCPRHPAPAMRVRAALSSAPQRAWE